MKHKRQDYSTRSATSCACTTTPADFAMKQVTVRSGKGERDRFTTLPASLIPLLNIGYTPWYQSGAAGKTPWARAHRSRRSGVRSELDKCG